MPPACFRIVRGTIRPDHRIEGQAQAERGDRFIVSKGSDRYIPSMDTHILDTESGIVGRHGAIKLHGPEGFAGMRAAGRLAASILDALVPHVVPGVTTQEIDDIVFAEMKAR